MKILVTGATGFVGKVLCAELIQHGYEVVAAMRTACAKPKNYEQVMVGSIDGSTKWTEALSKVDVVIHLAARVHVMSESAENSLAEFRIVNVEGTLRLAQEAVNAGVKRFIFISSIGVNGNSTVFGRPFSVNDKPKPISTYAISKFEAEQGLIKLSENTCMESVIIRPPLVYGFGAPGNFKQLLHALKRQIPLPLGAINNKRSFVYVENLVSLILRCIDHPAAANQLFLVSDGDDLSTTELLSKCAVALDVKATLLPIPQSWLEAVAKLVGKKEMAQRLCGNLQVDISKACQLLEWTPPVSVTDGLKATAKRFH